MHLAFIVYPLRRRSRHVGHGRTNAPVTRKPQGSPGIPHLGLSENGGIGPICSNVWPCVYGKWWLTESSTRFRGVMLSYSRQSRVISHLGRCQPSSDRCKGAGWSRLVTAHPSSKPCRICRPESVASAPKAPLGRCRPPGKPGLRDEGVGYLLQA